LGAAALFLGAAFAVVAEPLETRPDLVLVRTGDFSVTAGAGAAAAVFLGFFALDLGLAGSFATAFSFLGAASLTTFSFLGAVFFGAAFFAVVFLVVSLAAAFCR